MKAAVLLGVGYACIRAVLSWDFANQIENGNPAGYNREHEFQDYGAPFYGGIGSNISPPISGAKFKSHFMFGREEIQQVIDCLCLPVDPAKEGLAACFPYRFHNGNPVRWVTHETAVLIFLKRLQTRGSTVKHLQRFFGRTEGYISEVFNAVVEFITVYWVPRKIQRIDSRVFSSFRLRDYARALWRAVTTSRL